MQVTIKVLEDAKVGVEEIIDAGVAVLIVEHILPCALDLQIHFEFEFEYRGKQCVFNVICTLQCVYSCKLDV